MRILLATDGSASAVLAERAVASTRWPIGSVVRIAVVVPHIDRLASPVPPTDASDPVSRARTALESAERRIGGEGRRVEAILLEGRPASAIVEEAAYFDADLIVVGSRGHGRWQTTILGSVSAEVVDHAPCPVLVVRTEVLDPIVFGDDGSTDARHAESWVARWPRQPGADVTVVTVAPGAPILWSAIPGDGMALALDAYEIEKSRARREAEAVADATARRLQGLSVSARPDIRVGEPAAEIVAAAQDHRAGMIVVGTRGHGGITRLLLGSVARNVLLHAPCSVLIVRPTAIRAGGHALAAAATATDA